MFSLICSLWFWSIFVTNFFISILQSKHNFRIIENIELILYKLDIFYLFFLTHPPFLCQICIARVALSFCIVHPCYMHAFICQSLPSEQMVALVAHSLSIMFPFVVFTILVVLCVDWRWNFEFFDLFINLFGTDVF